MCAKSKNYINSRNVTNLKFVQKFENSNEFEKCPRIKNIHNFFEKYYELKNVKRKGKDGKRKNKNKSWMKKKINKKEQTKKPKENQKNQVRKRKGIK